MRPRQMLVIPITLCVALSGCAWLDHSSDSGLERDLAAQHLAIARVFYENDGGLGLQIRYPNGRSKTVDLPCCTRIRAESFARNRIALVDVSSSPQPFDPKAVGDAFSGPVVLMDEEGRVVERSEIRVNANLLSLSPDGKRFAFLGSGDAQPAAEAGVYVAEFRDKEVRKLASTDPLIALNHRVHPSLDWSSDGRSLLFTDADGVHFVSVESGKSEKVGNRGPATVRPCAERATWRARWPGTWGNCDCGTS